MFPSALRKYANVPDSTVLNNLTASTGFSGIMYFKLVAICPEVKSKFPSPIHDAVVFGISKYFVVVNVSSK